MRRVTVVTIDVVDVIAMAHLFVAASARVPMLVAFVNHVGFRRALVPVPIVFVMSVTAVEVVGVVVVLDWDVFTAWSVVVLVCLMRLVFDADHHASSLATSRSIWSLADEGRSIVS